MKRFDLMNSAYRPEKGKPIIYLYSRDKDRNRCIHRDPNHIPHFWVEDPLGEMEDVFGKMISEVRTKMPMDVKRARNKYEYHCEADLLFAQQRYPIDKKIRCGYTVENGNILPAESLNIPPKLGMFDIEVETPPEIMARPKNPIWPITSFQFSQNYSDEIDIFMLNTDIPITEEIAMPSILTGCQHAITYPVTFVHAGKDIEIHPNIYLYDDKKVMVKDVSTWFAEQQFDFSGGYNSNLFDWPYWIRFGIENYIQLSNLSPFGLVRCKPRKTRGVRGDLDRQKRISGRLQPYVKGVGLIDFYDMYKKWSGGRQGSKLVVKGKDFATSFDFHLVMERECDFHYIDLGDKVRESRTKHPLDWLQYCVGDAYALKILNEKCQLVRYFDQLRRIVGLPIEWAIHNSRLIDTRLLRLAEKPLPTRKYGKKHRVKGAIVLEPKMGIHENVAYIDEKSLYPMLIRVYNLSPDTWVKDSKDWKDTDIVVGPMEDGTILHFKDKPEGLMPRAVRKDMELREVYRNKLKRIKLSNPDYEFTKMLETLYKFLSCSYYGVTGYENFRFYNDAVRKAITFLGREALNRCKRDCKKAGYEVLYGDTDSIFVQLRTDMPGEARVVERVVTQTLQNIAYRHGARIFVEAKSDEWCKTIIFVPKIQQRGGEIIAAKKRYGYTDKDDNLYVVGLAPRRSSTPKLARDLILEWLQLILLKKDVDSAIDLVYNAWVNFEAYPLNIIGLPRGLHKIKYQTRNPWLDGCNFMTRNYGKIFREDKKPLLIWMVKERRKKISRKTKRNRYKLKRAASDDAQLSLFGEEPKVQSHRVLSKPEEQIITKQEKISDIKEGLDTDVICITEQDEDVPSELRQYIDWDAMRKRVLANHFKQMFRAIGVPWWKVIIDRDQTKLKERAIKI